MVEKGIALWLTLEVMLLKSSERNAVIFVREFVYSDCDPRNGLVGNRMSEKLTWEKDKAFHTATENWISIGCLA